MQTITTILLSVMASSGFWAFLQWFMGQKMKRDSVETEALRSLLHNAIYKEAKDRINEGTITAEDYDNLMYLYKPYKELGGNGTCERLIHEVEKLQLTVKGGGQNE